MDSNFFVHTREFLWRTGITIGLDSRLVFWCRDFRADLFGSETNQHAIKFIQDE